ncbi:unnamed protein product [Allacma fusca]|uniref:Fe2OG dioxygenase domain-containing protein n=1 Tax=Allacma fusca TaxID=39272 RepID=A0A8J2P2D4_9HEXA|nr:unnamed protein product [Allacma fusca]
MLPELVTAASNKPFIILLFHFLLLNMMIHPISLIQGSKLKSVPASAPTMEEKLSLSSFKEYPVSLPALDRLLRIENKFYKLLKKYTKIEENPDENLRIPVVKYLTRYKTEVIGGLRNWRQASSKERMDLRDNLNHPFLIFQMLRRLVYDFPPLYTSVLNISHFHELSTLGIDLEKWPSKQDANYYGTLVVVLHHFYDFSIHKFGRGTFGKIVTGVNLSAVQSVELNYIATKSECHSSAVEFMAFALDQARKFGGISMNAVRGAFKASIKEHDKAIGALSQNGNYGLFISNIGTISNFTQNRHKFITKKSYKKHLAKKKFPSRQGDTAELEEMDSHNYMSICKGENWQSNDHRKSLKCWYKLTSRILPYKMEKLHQHPLIMKVHDFMNPWESASLINYARPRLVPARTIEEGYVKDGDKVVRQRAGLIVRVEQDFPHPQALQDIERRMELITGLNVQGRASGEKLQVASTIPGGYMSCHLDSLGRSLKKAGHSRIATFMVYLNKVDAGGRTAFHRLGAAVRPAIHSAVFWFNHHPNGSLIDGMIHGGCPVVLGQKWVATKWIRWPGNVNKYKCWRERKEVVVLFKEQDRNEEIREEARNAHPSNHGLEKTPFDRRENNLPHTAMQNPTLMIQSNQTILTREFTADVQNSVYDILLAFDAISIVTLLHDNPPAPTL